MLMHQPALLAEHSSMQGPVGMLPAGHHMAQSGDGTWVGLLLLHLTQVRIDLKTL